MTNTVAPRVSRYFGAKPSQSRSPVPANTSATSSNVVLRRCVGPVNFNVGVTRCQNTASNHLGGFLAAPGNADDGRAWIGRNHARPFDPRASVRRLCRRLAASGQPQSDPRRECGIRPHFLGHSRGASINIRTRGRVRQSNQRVTAGAPGQAMPYRKNELNPDVHLIKLEL